METIWKVLKHLHGSYSFDVGDYAILILNQHISVPSKLLVSLWNEARFCATADGGTDKWYDFVSSLPKDSGLKKLHPDLTSGDFDSITPKILQQCRDNGVKVVRTPDQNKTDFHKALQEIAKHTRGRINSVITIIENSGRLDHILSNMNTLYFAQDIFGSRPVQLYLLSSECLTWLLRVGSHTIHIPKSLVESQATCGLIPLGAPCTVTTSGLKWNLNGQKMEFGGLISTSNTYGDGSINVVTVETDSPLIWTMTLNFDECRINNNN